MCAWPRLFANSKMEQQAIAGLKRQWKSIQALSEVLDSLRLEERSGVDLGNLAVKELERYAALAEQSKEEMRQVKEEHAAAVERLEDSVRGQKDEIRELQHQHSLEVCRALCAVVECISFPPHPELLVVPVAFFAVVLAGLVGLTRYTNSKQRSRR